jgi:hypothetical protein
MEYWKQAGPPDACSLANSKLDCRGAALTGFGRLPLSGLRV